MDACLYILLAVPLLPQLPEEFLPFVGDPGNPHHMVLPPEQMDRLPWVRPMPVSGCLLMPLACTAAYM